MVLSDYFLHKKCSNLASLDKLNSFCYIPRMKRYPQLKKLFKRLSHLQYLQRILMWDEAVMMPEGAGKARVDAMATLGRAMQKMLISKKTHELIVCAKQEDNLSPWDIANINWMEKLYLRANSVPVALMEEATKASMACEQVWRKLRAKNDWQAFLPYLKHSFKLVQEMTNKKSEALGLSPYNTQLEEYAPGFNQQTIDKVFDQLKSILPDLISQVIARQAHEKIISPEPPFPITQQKSLGIAVMKALGFDFQQGRLDVSHHPFCSGGPSDVRITTRYTESEFLTSLHAICHETGHALYEQGLPKKWIDQPVGKVDSMAMHESQSLLIEMELCRSLPFCDFLAPLLQSHFGIQPAFSTDNLYRLSTRVKPDLIRVDADEVTYPLHIILRYDIEKALFANQITIEDLPMLWESLMLKYLNVSPQGNDRAGVMQDVHWPAGIFGYFPAYTLGRLIAAQFFSTYLSANEHHEADVKAGNFQPLRRWLKQHIYAYASYLPTNHLLEKITGEPLNPNFFLERIKQRYLH